MLGEERLLSGSVKRASRPPLRLVTDRLLSGTRHREGPPLGLRRERLLSDSKHSASSRVRQRAFSQGPSGTTSSRARQRGPHLRLCKEGLFSGSSQTASYQGIGTGRGLLSGSAERGSSRTRHGSSPSGLGTEGSITVSAERASSQARYIYRACSQARQRRSPLRLGT